MKKTGLNAYVYDFYYYYYIIDTKNFINVDKYLLKNMI